MAKKQASALRKTTKSQVPDPSSTREEAPPATSTPADTPTADARSDNTPPTPYSPQARWSTGSWHGKATAVAEVARDSISATANTALDKLPPAVSNETRRLAPKLRTPIKSGPTTQLSIEETVREEKRVAKVGAVEVDRRKEEEVMSSEMDEGKEKSAPASGWIGWWSRPEVSDERETKDQEPAVKSNSNVADQDTAPPASSEVSKAKDRAIKPTKNASKDSTQVPAEVPQIEQETTVKPDEHEDGNAGSAQRTSWFGLWGSAPSSIDGHGPNQKSTLAEPAASNIASDGFSPLDEAVPQPTDSEKKLEGPQTSASWAFWSSSKGDGSKHAKTDSRGEAGELAIAQTSSESNPQPARLKEPESSSSGQVIPNEIDRESTKVTAKPKPKPKHKQQGSLAYSMTDSILKTSVPSGADDASISSEDKSSNARVQKHLLPNLLLPDLHQSLPCEEPTTYIKSLWQMMSRSSGSPQKHLTLTKHPVKIKKALAIGVHGFFPGPLIQKGPPTGTSLKFASHAASAISRYLSSLGPLNPAPTIEKIALEGEGMISSRLDTLWNLLLNFTPSLRTADLILVACHSQGVPVSIMLLARLLSFGVLKPDVRIAVCSMAGVNLGPFSSLQTRILGGSANELFDFARHDSRVSSDYREALQLCLRRGVRVLYVGSIDDQLVSLESALFSTISHPYIYRAVFVDGRVHAPGFVTALVSLCARLRNLGVKDHGLIRELSAPLAGSLYSGEGHSRIYEDEKVYDLAVGFALETVEAAPMEREAEIERFEPGTQVSNPYVLPWAMRGVLEEEIVKTELKGEIEELVKLFEEWKPQTKVLRDVKVRLEGLRSKL